MSRTDRTDEISGKQRVCQLQIIPLHTNRDDNRQGKQHLFVFVLVCLPFFAFFQSTGSCLIDGQPSTPLVNEIDRISAQCHVMYLHTCSCVCINIANFYFLAFPQALDRPATVLCRWLMDENDEDNVHFNVSLKCECVCVCVCVCETSDS